jgi:hypothetical protein
MKSISMVTPDAVAQSYLQPVMFEFVQLAWVYIGTATVRHVPSLTNEADTDMPPVAPVYTELVKKISTFPAVPVVTLYRMLTYLYMLGLKEPRPYMLIIGSLLAPELTLRTPFTELTVMFPVE